MLFFSFFLIVPTISSVFTGKSTNQMKARKFLKEYDVTTSKVYTKHVNSAWLFQTNITDANRKAMVRTSIETSLFENEYATRADNEFNWKNLNDPDMIRQFRFITDIGDSAMKNKTKLKRLNEVLSELGEIYSTSNVCLSEGGECLSLEPGLTRLFETSRDYNVLQEAWVKWRDVTGRKMKRLYSEFVELSNEAYRNNGYKDTGESWKAKYESKDFEEIIRNLFSQLEPLYKHLHTYVRRKLKKVYGEKHFPKSGHIPAHLFGNMWSQDWVSILDIVQPYDRESVDVTEAMIKQKYTPLKMFQLADEFFQSLGLIKLPQEFWDQSMIEKPKDRKVVCHASAWNFYNRKDFRIKQCTDVTMPSLVIVHHEMGHIQYYLQYKHQPVVYKHGANPGFHEAIGDVIGLSVATPRHLQKINLLNNIVQDKGSEINFLMSQALDKIAFLPFGYLIDQWRWSVFRGEVPPEEYNQKWWDLRCKYQGISPPVKRTEEDFDPGAKYHVPSNTPYIRYFVSNILQYQFHQALCKEANHTGPLHTCDIYRSHAAGTLLGKVLKLGSSKHWKDALELITGKREMDAQPILDYFEPLFEWLKEQNKDESIGWDNVCPIINNGTPLRISVLWITLYTLFCNFSL